MQTLEQFFNSVGSNANDIIARLGGSSALVMRFLAKFPADENFGNLRKGLDANDTKAAFLAAHTMKGLCANLGINSLFDKASSITEHLRGGDIDSAKTEFPALETEYNRVLESLGDLLSQ